ncbi:HAD-IA family hydrolase [Candidatus Woesearchaeota archaeon]|nr:HAD-IA family hydrolase [Candidatus Woesearchaeota archaeon]
MIKAIIFDLGGVIVDLKFVLRRIFRIFNVRNKSKFWQEMNHEMIPLCRGDINEKQFWKNVAKKYNMDHKKIPHDLLSKDFHKLIRLNKELLKLINKLKKRYKVAVISNIIENHSKVNERIGLYKPFDHVVLSYKVKMTKDSSQIFKLAVKKLRVKPKECIFIDDVKKFVKIARLLGMKSILFKNNKLLNTDLNKILN